MGVRFLRGRTLLPFYADFAKATRNSYFYRFIFRLRRSLLPFYHMAPDFCFGALRAPGGEPRSQSGRYTPIHTMHHAHSTRRTPVLSLWILGWNFRFGTCNAGGAIDGPTARAYFYHLTKILLSLALLPFYAKFGPVTFTVLRYQCHEMFAPS